MNMRKQLTILVLTGVALGTCPTSVKALEAGFKKAKERGMKQGERRGMIPSTPAPTKTSGFSVKAQEDLDTRLKDINSMTQTNYDIFNTTNEEASTFVTSNPTYFKDTEGDLFKKTIQEAYDKKISDLFKTEITAVNKAIQDRKTANMAFTNRITVATTKPALDYIKQEITDEKNSLPTIGGALKMDSLDQDSALFIDLDTKIKDLRTAYTDLLLSADNKINTLVVPVVGKMPTTAELNAINDAIANLKNINDLNTLKAERNRIYDLINEDWENEEELVNQLNLARDKQKTAIEDKAKIGKLQSFNEAVAQLKKMQTQIKENPTNEEKKTFTKNWNTYHKRSGAKFGTSAEAFYDKNGREDYTNAWKALLNTKNFAKMLQ